MTKLTARQEIFVAEYLRDLNATQAAIRAGYSKKTAARTGPELLGKPWVAEAVASAMNERKAKIGRASVDVLLDIQDVTRKAWAAGDYRTALKGLEMEGKHLGMFTDKVNLSGDLKTIIEIRDKRSGQHEGLAA